MTVMPIITVNTRHKLRHLDWIILTIMTFGTFAIFQCHINKNSVSRPSVNFKYRSALFITLEQFYHKINSIILFLWPPGHTHIHYWQFSNLILECFVYVRNHNKFPFIIELISYFMRYMLLSYIWLYDCSDRSHSLCPSF